MKRKGLNKGSRKPILSSLDWGNKIRNSYCLLIVIFLSFIKGTWPLQK